MTVVRWRFVGKESVWKQANVVLGAALALLLTACQSPAVRLSPEQQQVARELATIDPLADPAPKSTPIIDVHTHTFNARYLPLQGILLGKRDAVFPVTTLISDRCAKLIAKGLIESTALAPVPGQKAVPSNPDPKALREEHPGLICGILISIIEQGVQKGIWRADLPLTNRLQRLDEMTEQMTMMQRFAVRTAVRMMGMNDHIKAGTPTEGTISGTKAAARFLWTLTLSDAEIPTLFREMHASAGTQAGTIPVPMAGPITMVSHMMDLGPVYDQPPNGETLLDFPTIQVRRMEYFKAQPDSGLLYFVAYNPYRDYWPHNDPAGALEVVREAIERHGAAGVKVYPPSGYRAAGNQIRSRPCTPLTPYPGREWDARYKYLPGQKNQTLDAELTTLLEWCVSNDVPVLTHCGYGEFEARKGYGEYHSDPRFWKQFLESHSSPGQPCKLRLCLGHAGGEDYWFGTGSHSAWGECVFGLCTNYPNVYCEISTSDAMVDPARQAYFVYMVGKKYSESAKAKAAARTGETKPPYLFSRKLMYGTDWPLPDKGEPGAVLRATEQAFLFRNTTGVPDLRDLRSFYADYFSGNARRFLRMDSRSEDGATINTISGTRP
jgi:predicted TIM-barrel fold metal-dependent hydrolase